MLQLVPFNTTIQQSLRPVSSQVLQLSAASSTAEQSLLAHGLSSVYDPSTEEEAAPASKSPNAQITLQATPAEVLDTRSAFVSFSIVHRLLCSDLQMTEGTAMSVAGV